MASEMDTSIIWIEEIAQEMKKDVNTLQRKKFRAKYNLPIEKFCGRLGVVKCKWDKWKMGKHNG